MLRSNKLLLSNLSLGMLLLHPIAHADSNGLPRDGSQMQQLQTQIMDAKDRITVLEIALNTANQDISALRNSVALKLSSRIQPEATNSVAPRTANGHGR
jgi:hypothetical protein